MRSREEARTVGGRYALGEEIAALEERHAKIERAPALEEEATLELEGGRPFFLNSTVRDENDQLAVALTNPDLLRDGRVWLPLGTLHLALKKFLWRGVCYERLRVRNYGLAPVPAAFSYYFEADYAVFLLLEIAIYPARVQGPEATPEIVRGIRALNHVGGFDVLIVARGGGSLEDLWPFNEELVARAG